MPLVVAGTHNYEGNWGSYAPGGEDHTALVVQSLKLP